MRESGALGTWHEAGANKVTVIQIKENLCNLGVYVGQKALVYFIMFLSYLVPFSYLGGHLKLKKYNFFPNSDVLIYVPCT